MPRETPEMPEMAEMLEMLEMPEMPESGGRRVAKGDAGGYNGFWELSRNVAKMSDVTSIIKR